MKISSKIFLSLFLIALGYLTYAASPIIKERYLAQDQTGSEENEKIPENDSKNTATTADNQQENVAENEEEIDEEKEADEFAKEDKFFEITREDCEKECSGFDSEEDTDYCKQVCGLASSENPADEKDCDGLEDLKRDYCLKDLAIAETDAKICGRIEDKNVRTSCENRIMEDIIDKEMESRGEIPM